MRRFLQDGAVFAYSLGNLQDIRDRYTITGAPTVVKSPYGNALNFDGAADYITLTAEEEYNLRFDSGAQDFSVVAWVRRTVTGVFEYIISKDDAFEDGWHLRFHNNDTPRLYVNDKVGVGPAIVDTLWHCVACVVDRSADITVYTDGVPGTPGVAIGEVIATTTVPTMGCRSYDNATKFNGDIYAIVIYDRILTPDEVLDLATHKAFDY